MFVAHSGKKPQGQRPEKTGKENVIVDMSGTINTPNTNQFINTKTPDNAMSKGAIPKNPTNSQVTDFSIPPPLIQKNHEKPLEKNPREYASLIRELIRESHQEYRSQLEANIELKIKESLKIGFSDMLKEIQKITRISRSSEVSLENSASKASERGNEIEREDPGINHIMPRRLEFQYIPTNVDTNSNDNMSNAASVNTHRPFSSTRIDKWDVVFNGDTDSMNIEDFIFRIEYLQKHHGCPWMEIMGNFHLFLKREARDWYWNVIREKDIKKWSDLKEALFTQYRSNRSEYEYLRDFEERHQKQGENIDDYFAAMRKLRARLKSPLSEQEAVRIIRRNLKLNLSQILYPMKIYTVEQLRDECKEIERNYLKKEPTTASNNMKFIRPKRFVEELYENENEIENYERLEEINIKQKNNRKQMENQKTVICWNCRNPGHLFTDCASMQRNLFCYRCGMAGVITPKCPKCTENTMRSVSNAGESRSTQTPDVI